MTYNKNQKVKKQVKKDYSFSDIDKMKTPTENMLFSILSKHPKVVLFIGVLFLLYVADLVLTFLMAFKLI